MTTKMTERDKKILTGLGIFCIVGLFLLLVLMPLYLANKEMRTQIKNNQIDISAMEQKESALVMVRAENERYKQEFAQAHGDVYPLLKIQEIDQLLTGKVALHRLSAKKLQITMPEASASVTAYEKTSDEGSNPEQIDGIWIARAALTVSGEMTDLDALVDELANDTSGIRINSLDWSKDQRENVEYDVLNLQLEVLMSRKE